jgi:hypothetical protein
MQQTSYGDENQYNADTKTSCRESRCALRVSRAAQQECATDDEDGWKEDAKSTNKCTGNLCQSAAERTSKVAVDAESGQQPKCYERNPPYVMTMTSECFTNRTRSRRASGGR